MASFKPIVEQMAAEGADEDQIVRAYKAHIKCKVGAYYANKRDTWTQLKDLFSESNIPKADSKAEEIFYGMLGKAGINFKFQFPIGPYTADYLLGGFIVFEIDGPHHKEKHDAARDKYMRNMGYKVIRVPLNILCACPEAVIDEIKETLKIKLVK